MPLRDRAQVFIRAFAIAHLTLFATVVTGCGGEPDRVVSLGLTKFEHDGRVLFVRQEVLGLEVATFFYDESMKAQKALIDVGRYSPRGRIVSGSVVFFPGGVSELPDYCEVRMTLLLFGGLRGLDWESVGCRGGKVVDRRLMELGEEGRIAHLEYRVRFALSDDDAAGGGQELALAIDNGAIRATFELVRLRDAAESLAPRLLSH